MVYGKGIGHSPMLGKKVQVYWTGMRCWYVGEVVDCQIERKRKVYEIYYEADGIKCWHKLEGPGSVKWKPKK